MKPAPPVTRSRTATGYARTANRLASRQRSRMSEGASASPTPTVLHVLEALTGGTSRHVVDVVRATGGVNHVVATPRRRIGSIDDQFALEDLRRAGATVHHVEMRRTPWHVRNLASYLQLASLVRRYRPEVIH